MRTEDWAPMRVEMRTGVTGREGTADNGQTRSFLLSFLF